MFLLWFISHAALISRLSVKHIVCLKKGMRSMKWKACHIVNNLLMCSIPEVKKSVYNLNQNNAMTCSTSETSFLFSWFHASFTSTLLLLSTRLHSCNSLFSQYILYQIDKIPFYVFSCFARHICVNGLQIKFMLTNACWDCCWSLPVTYLHHHLNFRKVQKKIEISVIWDCG